MKVIIAITVTIGTTVIVICAYIMWRTISDHHGNILSLSVQIYTKRVLYIMVGYKKTIQRHAQNLRNNKFSVYKCVPFFFL